MNSLGVGAAETALESDNVANTFRNMFDIEERTCRAFAAEQRQVKVGTSSADMILSSTRCWRERVTQWCYDVIDHLGENRELTYIAMNILDRYTACRPTDERVYEVEAMSALFLAVRVGGSGNLSLHQLVSMSRDGILERDIISTGKAMISALSWDQRLLTPADFVRAFVNALSPRLDDDVKSTLLDSALFLVELAVFDLVLARKRPSLVGAAATLCAIHRLEVNIEEKEKLIHTIRPATSRFGDLSFFQHRLDLIYNEVPENQKSERPHVIEDDDVLSPRPIAFPHVHMDMTSMPMDH